MPASRPHPWRTTKRGKPGRQIGRGGQVGSCVSTQANEGCLAEGHQATHTGEQYQPNRDYRIQANVIQQRDMKFRHELRGDQQRQDEAGKEQAWRHHSSSST
jgi:hypothetical protein